MQLKESGEDYLETILILENRGGPVHAVEVAAEMKVSKASVSVAMKHLRQGGYIRIGAGREILLTQQGRGLAEAVYERHLLFSDLLQGLGVDSRTAAVDACHMEHAVSAESFAALKEYVLLHGMGPPEASASETTGED